MTEVKKAYLLIGEGSYIDNYYAIFDSESKARQGVEELVKDDKKFFTRVIDTHVHFEWYDNYKYRFVVYDDKLDIVYRDYKILPINVNENFKIQFD